MYRVWAIDNFAFIQLFLQALPQILRREWKMTTIIIPHGTNTLGRLVFRHSFNSPRVLMMNIQNTQEYAIEAKPKHCGAHKMYPQTKNTNDGITWQHQCCLRAALPISWLLLSNDQIH